MGTMRVLIAEDDACSRMVIERFLEPYARCTVARDGQEALDLYLAARDEGAPFDLIFLDIMMPKVDGQAVLASIRELETRYGVPASQGVKVIMTSALNDDQNIFDAHVSDCFNYLVKPLNRDKVLEQLRALGCELKAE